MLEINYKIKQCDNQIAKSSYLSTIAARRDPSSSWYSGQRLRLAIMLSEVRVQLPAPEEPE